MTSSTAAGSMPGALHQRLEGGRPQVGGMDLAESPPRLPTGVRDCIDDIGLVIRRLPGRLLHAAIRRWSRGSARSCAQILVDLGIHGLLKDGCDHPVTVPGGVAAGQPEPRPASSTDAGRTRRRSPWRHGTGGRRGPQGRRRRTAMALAIETVPAGVGQVVGTDSTRPGRPADGRTRSPHMRVGQVVFDGLEAARWARRTAGALLDVVRRSSRACGGPGRPTRAAAPRAPRSSRPPAARTHRLRPASDEVAGRLHSTCPGARDPSTAGSRVSASASAGTA